MMRDRVAYRIPSTQITLIYPQLKSCLQDPLNSKVAYRIPSTQKLACRVFLIKKPYSSKRVPALDALALRLRAALASLARPASHWSHRIDRAGRPLRGLRLAGPLAAYRVGAGPASGPTDQDHTLRCRLCGDAALGRRAAGAPRPVPAPRGRVERGPRN